MSKTAVTGMLISIQMDRNSAVPIHQQISDAVRRAICLGQMKPGDKLPSSRILAAETRVSRNAILQAFETLIEEGFLTGQVGSGTYVATTIPAATPNDFEAAEQQPDPTFRHLSHRGRSLLDAAAEGRRERNTPFMPDLPDAREFPIRTWLRLLNEASGRLKGDILIDPSPAGYAPLRQAIASHLNASRGMACDQTQVIITSGSQQSIDLICRLLLDSGDLCWFEEPGYFGTRAVIAGNGGTVIPVSVDHNGLCIEQAIEDHPTPRLIFVSAARQYPLGGTLSIKRRRDLLHFAKRIGSWIVEDDYDHEFRYAGASIPSIFGLDRNSGTIHIGTFSKILLPSFRLGYMVVPPNMAAAFAAARGVVDRHASLIEQMVLSEFMARGLFVAHIRRMRRVNAERQKHLAEGLNSLFGRSLDLLNMDTGTNLVLALTDDADDVSLSQSIAAMGVVARPLSPYYAKGDAQKGLLLGFSAFSCTEISSGLARLEGARDLMEPHLAL